MSKKRDRIIETVLKCFKEAARPFVRAGRGVNVEICLDRAVSMARTVLWSDYNRNVQQSEIWEHIKAQEGELRPECKKIVFDMEKRNNILEIRKTSVAALLDEFKERTGYEMIYKLRDNSTVGFSIKMNVGQYLKFNASYKKVLTPSWLDSLEVNLRDLMDAAARLGAFKVSSYADF